MPNEFNDFIEEMLQDWYPIHIKRMFGSFGVFRDGRMFAIIDDDMLYFKANENTKHIFENINCPQFTYMKKDNKKTNLNYFKAPDECYDSTDVMEYYANIAWQAAEKNKDI
ncbi:MAG: TfoX/Sxy family protein [Alphaproteobacteria bacterium]